MKKIFDCRRSSLALIGMAKLFILGLIYPETIEYIALPIAILAGGVAVANAYEKSRTKKKIESEPEGEGQ